MKVNITYFGMEGTGRTMTEAKKDAGRKVEEALAGSYEPMLLESRGWAIIIWRDPHGWRFNTIAEKGEYRKDAFRCYTSGTKDRLDVFASALLHLAQMTWDGTELLPPCLGSLPALLSRRDCDGRRLLSQFAHWRGFQLAYKHAKANGIGQSDTEWHRWAGEHTAEFAA
jgi:hypothetical protein